MKLITRMLLGLIAVVATLFVAAAFFVSTVDLGQHKDRIQQFVLDQTGRPLEIRGQAEAQLFPWAGFALHDVALAGADGYINRNFANVRHIEVRVRLLPLIVGNISIKHVHLHGLELDLQRNSEGRANWDDLMSNTSVVTTDVSQDDVLQEVEAGTPVVAALSVGHLVVSDSTVHWRDQMAGHEITLTGFELAAGEIRLTEPFHFETAFTLSSDTHLPVSSVRASGMAGINLAENLYGLDSLEVDSQIALGNAESADSENRFISTHYSGSVIADLNAQTLDLAPLSLNVEGVPLSGEIHITELFSSPGVFGLISSQPFDLASILESRNVVLPPSFDKTLLSDFRLYASFQRADENFLINDVSAGNQQLELNGNFQITNFLRAPVLTGSVSSNAIKPSRWTQAMGYQPVDASAFADARISANVRQSGQLLVLNNINLQLDDTTIGGDLEVVKTDAGQYPIRFELHADALDLGRYFSVDSGLTAVTSLASDPGIQVPVKLIGELDIQGKLTASALTWSGLQLTDVSVPVSVGQGRFEGREIQATAYQGALFATAVLDVTPDEPLLTATANLNAFELEPMANALAQTPSTATEPSGSAASLSGTGIVNMDLLSRGVTSAELARRAGGALSLRLTDGKVADINLTTEILLFLSALRGQDVANDEAGAGTDIQAVAGQETTIDELSVSWELADGSLYSDDLDMRVSGLKLSGRGAIDLESSEVDYLLAAEIAANDAVETADEIDPNLAQTSREMIGTQLPLSISGPLKPLTNGFPATLRSALRAELEASFLAGIENPSFAEDPAPLDVSVIIERLNLSKKKANLGLDERLDIARKAAEEVNNQRREQALKEGTEASNGATGERELETEELQNRLESNLNELKKKLSNLSDN